MMHPALPFRPVRWQGGAMSVLLPFATLEELRLACRELPEPDQDVRARAERRQEDLTKPAGSLGRLEELAVWVAEWRGRAVPAIVKPLVIVFAGNHGVAVHGVSAYPAAVTAQMVANFAAGGAAINQLAGVADAELRVVPISLDEPTADIATASAMSDGEFLEAVGEGWRAVPEDCDLLAVGEMGIGNTTIASAICAAALGGPAERWVGPGTGVDAEGRARKVDVVARALSLHGSLADDPLTVARVLGGRELAAILGAVLAARHRSIPVLLDGFVASAAVLPLFMENRAALAHCRAAHRSAEWAHGALLEAIGLSPLLDLGMRLGEGSGAALAIGLVRAALACHSGMATFSQAGVGERCD